MRLWTPRRVKKSFFFGFLVALVGISAALGIFFMPKTEAVHTPLAPWLCDDGTFTSETQDGACERLDRTTVSPEIQETCHNFPTEAERRDCIAGESETEEEQSCEARSSFGANWFYCPVIRYVSSTLVGLQEGLDNALNIDDEYYANAEFRRGWGVIRNLAYLVLVPVTLVMVIGTALGFDFISAYTVKRALPRLVIAVMGIALSYDLCVFMIELFNTLGAGAYGLVTTAFPEARDLTLATLLGESRLEAVLASAAIVFAIVFAFTPLLILLLTALVVVVVRQMLIVGLILAAPLALLGWIFPANQKLWARWWGLFTHLLMMYPLMMAVIGLGRVFAHLVEVADEQAFVPFISWASSWAGIEVFAQLEDTPLIGDMIPAVVLIASYPIAVAVGWAEGGAPIAAVAGFAGGLATTFVGKGREKWSGRSGKKIRQMERLKNRDRRKAVKRQDILALDVGEGPKGVGKKIRAAQRYFILRKEGELGPRKLSRFGLTQAGLIGKKRRASYTAVTKEQSRRAAERMRKSAPDHVTGNDDSMAVASEARNREEYVQMVIARLMPGIKAKKKKELMAGGMSEHDAEHEAEHHAHHEAHHLGEHWATELEMGFGGHGSPAVIGSQAVRMAAMGAFRGGSGGAGSGSNSKVNAYTRDEYGNRVHLDPADPDYTQARLASFADVNRVNTAQTVTGEQDINAAADDLGQSKRWEQSGRGFEDRIWITYRTDEARKLATQQEGSDANWVQYLPQVLKPEDHKKINDQLGRQEGAEIKPEDVMDYYYSRAVEAGRAGAIMGGESWSMDAALPSILRVTRAHDDRTMAARRKVQDLVDQGFSGTPAHQQAVNEYNKAWQIQSEYLGALGAVDKLKDIASEDVNREWQRVMDLELGEKDAQGNPVTVFQRLEFAKAQAERGANPSYAQGSRVFNTGQVTGQAQQREAEQAGRAMGGQGGFPGM